MGGIKMMRVRGAVPSNDRRMSIALCHIDDRRGESASQASAAQEPVPTIPELEAGQDDPNESEADTAGLLGPPPDGIAIASIGKWRIPLWSWIVGMSTLSVVISYADRTNISVAILPMAEDFGWNESTKGSVLSVFFIGYAITQILGGWLSDRSGGKYVLAYGITIWSFCTFITPAAAELGWLALIANRIALGLGEGVAFPAIHSIISSNVPVPLQSSAVSLVTAASYAGTVFAFAVSPKIIGQWDWRWVFYIFGGLALVWLPLWLPTPVASETMRYQKDEGEESTVGDREPLDSTHGQIYRAGQGALGQTNPLVNFQQVRSQLLPELKELLPLFMTKPVLAICIAQYTQSWGMYTLINWLPSFFAEEYNIEVENLGAYTLGPYIVQALVGLASGPMADALLANGWKTVAVRRIFQSVGMIGPALCLMAAVALPEATSEGDVDLIITIGLGLSAFSLAGVSVSHLDVAPRHAGAVFGAGNTAATLAGFIGVGVVGLILKETDSWALVFGIAAVHYFVGAIIWNMWVGGEPLPQDRA